MPSWPKTEIEMTRVRRSIPPGAASLRPLAATAASSRNLISADGDPVCKEWLPLFRNGAAFRNARSATIGLRVARRYTPGRVVSDSIVVIGACSLARSFAHPLVHSIDWPIDNSTSVVKPRCRAGPYRGSRRPDEIHKQDSDTTFVSRCSPLSTQGTKIRGLVSQSPDAIRIKDLNQPIVLRMLR